MAIPLAGLKPVGTCVLNASTSNITTSAWTVLKTSVERGASVMEIFNGTGSTLAISNGSIGGGEAADTLDYTILQGSAAVTIPMDVFSGKPLSVKALDNSATSGILVINLFG